MLVNTDAYQVGRNATLRDFTNFALRLLKDYIILDHARL